jgi:hypothetical protein
MTPPPFAGAYWAERKETRQEIAGRISTFLSRVGSTDATFERWFRKSHAGPTATMQIRNDPLEIERILKPNRRDADKSAVSELGVAFTAWNGRGVSLSATIGAFSPFVRNSVVVSFDEVPNEWSSSTWRGVVHALIGSFDPDRVVVTNSEILARAKASFPWEAGWLQYERGSDVREYDVAI